MTNDQAPMTNAEAIEQRHFSAQSISPFSARRCTLIVLVLLSANPALLFAAAVAAIISFGGRRMIVDAAMQAAEAIAYAQFILLGALAAVSGGRQLSRWMLMLLAALLLWLAIALAYACALHPGPFNFANLWYWTRQMAITISLTWLIALPALQLAGRRIADLEQQFAPTNRRSFSLFNLLGWMTLFAVFCGAVHAFSPRPAGELMGAARASFFALPIMLPIGMALLAPRVRKRTLFWLAIWSTVVAGVEFGCFLAMMAIVRAPLPIWALVFRAVSILIFNLCLFTVAAANLYALRETGLRLMRKSSTNPSPQSLAP